ncbi:hypothetical protein [Streptomyces cadmiisoli]|uniref:hypothetical protein n=1 Tax=Streptomyces cadmiisoli TaxID=2184053 RepID=UPI003D716548
MITTPTGADWIAVVVAAWTVLFGIGLAVQAGWRRARRRIARVLDQRPAPLDSYNSDHPRSST